MKESAKIRRIRANPRSIFPVLTHRICATAFATMHPADARRPKTAPALALRTTNPKSEIPNPRRRWPKPRGRVLAIFGYLSHFIISLRE
jgi:hypothetical protein